MLKNLLHWGLRTLGSCYWTNWRQPVGERELGQLPIILEIGLGAGVDDLIEDLTIDESHVIRELPIPEDCS